MLVCEGVDNYSNFLTLFWLACYFFVDLSMNKNKFYAILECKVKCINFTVNKVNKLNYKNYDRCYKVTKVWNHNSY